MGPLGIFVYTEAPGPGKTAIIIYAMIVRACKEKCRQVVLRKHFNTVKRSVFNDTFPKIARLAFPLLKIKYNRTDYIAFFPNGSEIHFLGLDDGQRTEKVLGLEFSTIFFNEISEIPYSSIQIVLTRLAEKNDIKKKVYYDMNPPNKSAWSYYLFIKKLDPIENIPIENENDYASMLLLPNDNLENIDKEYLKILESMPEKEKNRFLLGIFNDESEGQVYYSFKRELHTKKKLEKTEGTVFIGMDFNVNPMTAVVVQYINNKLHVIDEVYLENADTFKMANELKKKGFQGCTIIPDSTGGNRKTSGLSDFEILSREGFKIENVRNPFVVDRINNVNRLFSSESILINADKCKKLINDLEKVVWKDNKPDQHGANKMLTHISDALGYAAWKLEPLSSTKLQRTVEL